MAYVKSSLSEMPAATMPVLINKVTMLYLGHDEIFRELHVNVDR